jgi:hypothetical protein
MPIAPRSLLSLSVLPPKKLKIDCSDHLSAFGDEPSLVASAVLVLAIL